MTMTNKEPDLQVVEARERIAIAAGVALLAAGLILVIAVLPAEYGVDPLGTGAKLGLSALSEAQQAVDAFAVAAAGDAAGASPVVAPQDREHQQETIEVEVEPRGWMEYKYRLEKGEALLYSWTATSPLHYELHGEPDGAPRGYAETFETRDATDQVFGTFTAPFSGIHGWYWENRGDQAVTIALTTSGFYSMSHEFRDGEDVQTKMFR